MPHPTRHRKLLHGAAAGACLLGLATAAGASAQSGSAGGAAYEPPPPPPKKAKIVNGKAIAPRGAPARIKRVIAAGNRLIGKPYRYGGGHKPFSSGMDTGYDCSGTLSYALYGGRFVSSPLDSTGFMSWARRGRGRWITLYANSGHAYMVVAGLRLDTGYRDDPSKRGPAWSKRARPSGSYALRHPRGY